MASVVTSPDASLADILKILEWKATGNSDRCEAYSKFGRHFRENEVSFFALDVAKSIGRVLAVIKKDATSSCVDVAVGALQVMGSCLHDTDVVRAIKKVDAVDVLKELCLVIHKAEDKNVCACALWCLKSQNLDSLIIQEKTEEILTAVEFAVGKWGGTSSSVVHECVNTIERLTSQAPSEMSAFTSRWIRLLIPLLVHEAIRVRERALAVLEDNMKIRRKNQETAIKDLKQAIKQKVIPQLIVLFRDGQEAYTMKCWSTLVQLLGTELHNVHYLNEVLPVVEMGFKSTEASTKIAAFQAWQQLIDNFALNQDLLQDPKRIKLIMQVFKHNNARNEVVAMEKLKCWWHFIWLLGNKVSPNFDMVAAPLLRFCVGGKTVDHGGGTTPKALKPGASPVTPHLKLSGAGPLQYPVFREIQLLGCEVLAYFLGRPSQDIIENFKLDCLRYDVVSGPSFFLKHSSLFITLAVELFCCLGQHVTECLIQHIWQWLIFHLKNAIGSPAKLDIREVLNTLLLQFQILVLSKTQPNDLILKMFESICSLPKKILCSSVFSIGGGEMVNGTPAIFIVGLLLTPNLLQTCVSLESYQSIFSSILDAGMSNSICTMSFLQSVLEILRTNSEFVDSIEQLWHLWNSVASVYMENVTKTNEVNQGDSLEHDFSCSVLLLSFPAAVGFHTMPQALLKSMIKTWTEVYSTVSRLAALVTNAEANIICEEVCSRILASCHDNTETVDAAWVDMNAQMSHGVVSCLDFSSIGNSSAFSLAASPKKWTKKQQRPLENIHSLVHLLARLQKHALTLTADTNKSKKGSGVSLQPIFNTLVDIFSTIFNHVTYSDVIWHVIDHLAQPVGDLFAAASSGTGIKVYNTAFGQKLEKLYADICTCLQSRYTSSFDSKLLHKLSPLLEATFLHSRPHIKKQALGFWSSTFGKAAELDYPDKLKPVLSKVKAKSLIALPGWSNADAIIIAETPVSQMTQTQAPEPYIPGMPSPHKIQHGSFLNKPVSPKLAKSPLKAPVSPRQTKKKNLSLDGFYDGDFVVIKHTPKKKMVLTDHQKEVLKEKRALPAMYNSLENSVDASLMSAHFSTDTQMEATVSETPTPTDSQPFTVFGSVIPPSGKHQKEIEKSSKPAEDKVSPKTDLAASGARRRSVRFKEAASEKSDKDAHTENYPLSSSKILDKEYERDKTAERNAQSKHDEIVEVNATKETPDGMNVENCSVVVIEDSEPNDTDKDLPDINEEMAVETMKKGGTTSGYTEPIDLTKSLQFENCIDSSNQEDKNRLNGSGKCFSGSSENLPFSVPQNLLGEISVLQTIISSSSGENRSSSAVAETDFKLSGVEMKSSSSESEVTVAPGENGIDNCSNKTTEKDKASEPLLSWTQKLNELSQSPRMGSPSRKVLSQDTGSSPGKRLSPFKSPRRNKKKIADENQSKGALDKWLVRSPDKKNIQELLQTNAVVANTNATIIEETQSPSKFANQEKETSTSPSVMETPPKNILENITFNHVNSNRKLFSSQDSDIDPNIVEDSNIVPSSPKRQFTSKGTPVLKLKKLTEKEILMYSPSRKDTEKAEECWKSERRQNDSVKKSKCAINLDSGHVQDESSHEHDDFSVFTPLDGENQPASSFSFFSDGTAERIEVMHIDEKALVKMSDKIATFPGSENLFNQAGTQKEQDVNCNQKDCNSGEINTDAFDPCLTNTLRSTDDKSKCLQESCSLSSQDLRDMEIKKNSGTKEQSQEEEFDISNSDTLMSQTCTPVDKSRKRKQITPKKLTPEEAKQFRKKRKEEGSGSSRKMSTRLREKEEKLSQPSVERDSQDKKCEINESESVIRKKMGKISERTDGEKKIKANENHDASTKCRSSRKDTNVSSLEKLVTGSQQIQQMESQENQYQNGQKKKGRNKIDTKDKETKKEMEKQSKTDHSQKILKSETLTQGHEKVLDEDNAGGKSMEESVKKKEKEENMDIEEETEIEDPVYKAEVVGQKTPETNRTGSKEPERRSTTKHKKAVVQKMNLRGSKVVLVNDSDSNLDSEDVRGFNEDKKSEEALSDAGKHEKDLVMEIDNPKFKDKGVDEKESCEDGRKSETDSDDDIPIAQIKDKIAEKDQEMSVNENVPSSQLKGKMAKKSVNNTEKKRSESMPVQSPVVKKLRSNTSINTRSRSQDKIIKRSPQMRKSINLAVKRTQKRNIQKKLIEDSIEVKTDGTEEEAENMPVVNCVTAGISALTRMEEEKVDEKSVEKDTANNINVEKELQMVESEENDSVETPKKGISEVRSKVTEVIMTADSDSKLIVGSRKFAKRSSVARRSILKPGSESSTEVIMSPQTSTFHPIMVGRICSPSASPSASILKKRRLSGDSGSDTSSPPNKQRRVSFAFPLAEVSSGSSQGTDRPSSPLVLGKNSAEMSRREMESEDTQNQSEMQTMTDLGKPVETQSTQGSPSQKIYESTQEAETGPNEPVCPELVGCKQSVEKVLPQLTSSMWSRGLTQLVRARNIHTVGDLSALTEADIHSLPIRSPKVATVKNVLSKYGKTLETSRAKLWSAPKVKLDTKLKTGEESGKTEIPVNVGIQQLSEGDANKKEEIESLLASSCDLLDEVNRLSQGGDQSEDSNQLVNQSDDNNITTSQSDGSSPSLNPSELISGLLNVKDLSSVDLLPAADLTKLGAKELATLSGNLTSLLGALTSKLVDVNKALENVVHSKCSSPKR